MTLPARTKARLEGLTCLHSYSYGATLAGRKDDASQRPSACHPLVRVIPETGRKALYLCRLMTDRINELTEAESRLLLDEMFDHLEKPEFTYQHRWMPGDLLIWDNYCTVHARTDFSPNERRMLKRLTVSPLEAVGMPAG
jgi:taurine dioxygenase